MAQVNFKMKISVWEIMAVIAAIAVVFFLFSGNSAAAIEVIKTMFAGMQAAGK